MRFPPPLLASLRIAGLVIPWMLSRSTFLCRFAPPLPSPFPPFPRPDILERRRCSPDDGDRDDGKGTGGFDFGGGDLDGMASSWWLGDEGYM
uniref:Uncharacterized protein n=1 Tax=Oryza brachyantha TaxID=4533 RepID=J3MLV4_ORYBR